MTTSVDEIRSRHIGRLTKLARLAEPEEVVRLARRCQPFVLPLAVLLPVGQLLALLWMIWARPLEVPFWDEWAMVGLLRRADEGTLGWSDFWAFHNEHRIVIPRLVNLVSIELTGWNRQITMTFNLLLVVATAALLVRCLARTFSSRALVTAMTVPTSLLILSLTRHTNWFLPLTDKIPTVVGVVLCAWAVAVRPVTWRWFFLGIAGALVASLSSLGGLLTWIAFLPPIWMSGRRRTAIWVVTALAIIIPYAVGFPGGDGVTPGPLTTVAFVLSYLGAPIGYAILPTSFLFGLLSLVLLPANVLVLRRLEKRWLGATPALGAWIGLALFALGTAGLAALGRTAQYGVREALSWRFHAFSGLWWLAFFVVAAVTVTRWIKVTDDFRAKTGNLGRVVVWANVVVLALALAGVMVANIVGLWHGADWATTMWRNQGCVRDYAQADDACLERYYPSAKFVRRQAKYLERHHLGIFRHAAAASESR